MPKFNNGDVVMVLEKSTPVWGVVSRCGEKMANICLHDQWAWQDNRTVPTAKEIEEVRKSIVNVKDGQRVYLGSQVNPDMAMPYVADAYSAALTAWRKMRAQNKIHDKAKDAFLEAQRAERAPLVKEMLFALNIPYDEDRFSHI